MENRETYSDSAIFDNGEKPNGTVYSDRMLQWDYKKHDDLCQKHFGDKSQYWSGRSPEKIQAFLRDYMNDQNVLLCRIEYCVNASSGYPIWRFDYKK